MAETRTEHDFLGSLELPAGALYGIHSLRSRQVFSLARQPLHPELIRALAEVKLACALANRRLGNLSPQISDAICQAAREVASGQHHESFVTDALQGGAGTSANMNANEVLANRAAQILGGNPGDHLLVHPLDHVNLCQSTNDVFPTAVRVAALRLLKQAVEAASYLQGALQAKEAEFQSVLKVGRTEMQDAVPITLGQEFAAWAQSVKRDWWRLYNVEERLRQVNLGGTAVGTGLNAGQKFIFLASELLRDITGLPISRAENLIDVTQNCDVFAEVSGLLKSASVNLAKIASDLRLLSSGPRAGFGEINLPEIQPGSSIMPGKVNPVIPEAVSQAAFQIQACDQAVTLAAQNGQLELNAFLPFIAYNLFNALALLGDASRLLADKCIAGISANAEHCQSQAENSLGIAAVLVPVIGYEEAARVARRALAEGRRVQDVALEEGLLEPSELSDILSIENLTMPGTGPALSDKETE